MNHEIAKSRIFPAFDFGTKPTPGANPMLRAMAKCKQEWMLAKIDSIFRRRSISLLEVGDQDLLARPLAESGVEVTPFSGDAYHLPFPDESFQAVAAMDFLANAVDPAAAVREISRVLRPGGVFFFHSFNRNWLTSLAALKLVDWVVRKTPKPLQRLGSFLKPRELSFYCDEAGLQVEETTGLMPKLGQVPLENMISGVVPDSIEFELAPTTAVSYMGFARKIEARWIG